MGFGEENVMDTGVCALAHALETAGAGMGWSIAVNRRAGPGEVAVSLSRTRSGKVAMLRQPLPGEGGRVTLNHPDTSLSGGCLPEGTLAWVAQWVLIELETVRSYARLLANDGLSADDFHPGMTRVSRPLARLAAHTGCDLMDMFVTGTWIRSQNGYTVNVPTSETPGGPANHADTGDTLVFHRHLGDIRTEGIHFALGTGGVLISDDTGIVRIRIKTDDPPPETMLTAAAGRQLDDLILLPADAGEGCTIETAELNGGNIVITARCPRDRLAQGDHA